MSLGKIVIQNKVYLINTDVSLMLYKRGMKAYKNYKHLIRNNIFGIKNKIDNFRKPNKNANKNRKFKN